ALTESLGVRAYLALWTTHLGEGLLVSDQTERAHAVARHALDLAKTHKERGHQAWASRLLGDVAARGSHAAMDAAAEWSAQALALAEELKMHPLTARTHLALGQLHARAGDRRKSQEHLGEALRMLREMDIRFWSARTVEELMGLGDLFIVARNNVQLFEYLKEEFAGEPVTVLLDPRHGNGGPDGDVARRPPSEEDRRRHAEVDDALRTRGFAVVSR